MEDKEFQDFKRETNNKFDFLYSEIDELRSNYEKLNIALLGKLEIISNAFEEFAKTKKDQ